MSFVMNSKWLSYLYVGSRLMCLTKEGTQYILTQDGNGTSGSHCNGKQNG